MLGVSLRLYRNKHNGLVSCISVGFALPILLTMGNARASIRGVGNKSNSTLFVCLYVKIRALWTNATNSKLLMRVPIAKIVAPDTY